jgi:ectoine hydroxylase-related dioxygenase (phytanoyl-CoA dioxygenase family)
MTAEAAAFFHENGFLVIEDAYKPEEIQELRDETVRICRGDKGMFNGLSLPADNLTDDEVIRNYLCIHFPHKLSELMFRNLSHPAFVDVLTQIIGPNVKCMQSMLFIKSAGKPGQAWHQDEDYIPTRDRSLCGGWIAMDDAHVENGCLWVIPGSQKRGILWEQHWHGDKRFDCALESHNFPYSNSDAVPVEVRAGSIVFFNGYLLHRSLPNYREIGFRRSLVNHYMSAESFLPWGSQALSEQPVATMDARDIVMIAGEDPYAWKGIVDVNRGHVRPDGSGGCGTNEYNSQPLQEH